MGIKLIKKTKQEARMHLGRCVNCHGGWTKTNYVDELEPDVRKYFKGIGFVDNDDVCPKCVAAAKDYLAKNAASESGEELYNVFLDGAVWAENVSKEKANAIVNAYDGEKDCWMEKADANESFEGWDNWEEVEGLEDALEGIENLTYELRSCVRGAKTHCKDWKSLALYIKGLASNLDDAAELMAYKTDSDNDDESANESDNPVGELFDALKQALAGKGYKVSQFTSDKEFVGQRKAYDGISIENEDPNAYHKNPYRIVLDTDDNLFRIFFPGVRRKSVTGQPGSISGIVKFILRDLNLDESKKKKNPSKDFSSTVEEDEDGRKKSH